MSSPQPIQDVRPSPIAGRWYPRDPEELTDSVDDFIATANIPPITGRVVGILAPHAGHAFSGAVAGHAFKAAQNVDADVIALIGPSHYPYPSALITSGHQAYRTPLGTVPIDHDALHHLRISVPLDSVRADPEHALEIELPFLQRIMSDFRLIPIAMLDQDYEMAETLGNALADMLAEQSALLVASSDLSHFYRQEVANELDQQVINAISAFDPAGVIDAEDDGRKIACGHGAIAAVMIAARKLGADSAQILDYATSGDINGDYGRVVGYTAAVFYDSTAS